jgi:hypothetical protein
MIPVEVHPPVLGLLCSQIGYEAGDPVRLIVRAADRNFCSDDCNVRIRGDHVPLRYWGSLWGSHWWVAEVSSLPDGVHHAEFVDAAGDSHHFDPLEVGAGILWDRTFDHVALEQLDRRARLAETKLGWMDAGMPWQEANSHASMVIALLDVLETGSDRLNRVQRERLIHHILLGNEYLALLQDTAAKRAKPEGSLSHMVPRYEDQVIMQDASKAAVAWAMSSRLLQEGQPAQAKEYLQRSIKAVRYCLSAPVSHESGFHNLSHGVAEDYRPPAEHCTRDLLMMAWAAMELARNGEAEWLRHAASLLRQVMNRQAAESEAIDGLHGFFFTFSDRIAPEQAWNHQIKTQPIGTDAGATFPHYLVPMIQMLRLWPDHEDAPKWRRTIEKFAYGYLLPACRRSPFLILPNGLIRGQGLIWFAGPWHGMNVIYGLGAALCLKLAKLFADPAFRQIATGNLQWIAGLNAGVTRASLVGSHLFSMDIADGIALPSSMIYGVGHRCAGNWTTIRGSICNGFSVGDQFQFDTPPQARYDGPHSLTDEDWIPHAAGWLSGLVRL